MRIRNKGTHVLVPTNLSLRCFHKPNTDLSLSDLDIKILNTDDIKVIDIHPRELMQEIVSLAVDSFMLPGNLILEELIIIRSPHRPG
jgi:hypothetical protein